MMSDLLASLLRLLARWSGIEPRPGPRPDPPPTPPPTPPLPPAPSPAPRPTPGPDPSAPDPADPAAVVAAINAARTALGLAVLLDDARLDESAGSWARCMASGQRLTHGDFAARIAACYPRTSAGEDIGEGQPTADAVVAAWMASPPHRANILADFAKVGAGAARDASGAIFWCADFVGRD